MHYAIIEFKLIIIGTCLIFELWMGVDDPCSHLFMVKDHVGPRLLNLLHDGLCPLPGCARGFPHLS